MGPILRTEDVIARKIIVSLTVRTSFRSPAQRNKEICEWIVKQDLRITGGNIAIDPITFEPSWVWHFEKEEDKILFLLKWSEQ